MISTQPGLLSTGRACIMPPWRPAVLGGRWQRCGLAGDR
jgi:hypothetical protein